jgi:hypothetical protein
MYVKQSPAHLVTHTPAVPKGKKIRSVLTILIGNREQKKLTNYNPTWNTTPTTTIAIT